MNWMSRRMVRREVSSSAARADAEGQEPDLMRWWMRTTRSQWIFDFRDLAGPADLAGLAIGPPCLIFDLARGMEGVSLKR